MKWIIAGVAALMSVVVIPGAGAQTYIPTWSPETVEVAESSGTELARRRRVGAPAEAMVTVVTLPVTRPSEPATALAGFETWYRREHPKVVATLTWVAGSPVGSP